MAHEAHETEAYLRNLVTETEREISYQDMYAKAARLIADGYLIHGTENEFEKFDPSMIRGGMRAEYGYGAYFTDAPYKALEYGYNIVCTRKDLYRFLNLEGKPSEEHLLPITSARGRLARLESMLDQARSNREYDELAAEIDRTRKMAEMTRKETAALMTMERALGAGLGNMEQVLKTTINNLPSDHMPAIAGLFMKCGYDGVRCGNQYVIFNFGKLNGNTETVHQ